MKVKAVEVADIIMHLRMNENYEPKEIAEYLNKKGYQIGEEMIVDFLKDAKINAALFGKKEIARMLHSSVRELYKQTNDLKRYLESFELKQGMPFKDKNKRIDSLLKIQSLLNKIITDIAKITGEIESHSVTVNAKEINVTQNNAFFLQNLVKLVDEGRIEIKDEELRTTYERIKRRPELAGFDYNISESTIPAE